MILVGVAIVLVLAVFGLRAVGGVRSPDRLEQIYVALSPLPWVVAVLVPAIAIFNGPVPPWVRESSWIGVVLSLVLMIVGLVLVVRSMAYRMRWGWPLAASVVLAASPFVVLATSAGLLWFVGRMR